MRIGLIYFEGKRTDLPLWVGGIGNTVYCLSKYLIKQGHDVSVLTHYAKKNEFLEKIDVKLYFSGLGIASKIRHIFNFFRKDFDIIHINQLHKPIHVQFIKIIKKITKSRAKIVYSIYSHADKISKSIEFADKVLFTYHHNYNKIDYLPRNKKELVSLSPDDSFFKVYNVHKDPKKFLCNYAHQEEFDKSNFYFFGELKKKIPDFKLFWPTRRRVNVYNEWDILKNRFGENTKWIGITNMPELMKNSAFYILIVSSQESRTKPPLTILEAMASGVIVICSRNLCLENLIIHKKTGLIFEDNLSEIIDLILKKDIINKIRKKAFDKALEFKNDKAFSVYMKVYNDIIDK